MRDLDPLFIQSQYMYFSGNMNTKCIWIKSHRQSNQKQPYQMWFPAELFQYLQKVATYFLESTHVLGYPNLLLACYSGYKSGTTNLKTTSQKLHCAN